MDPMPTTGLIMAGGRSRRMGRDKALIEYEGRTLLARAEGLLASLGIADIRLLGRPDHPRGEADSTPDQGPAAALQMWLAANNCPRRIIVLPVDMPHLDASTLSMLLGAPNGGYFDDQYLPFVANVQAPPTGEIVRMRQLLAALAVPVVPVSPDLLPRLRNWNRPEDIAAT